MFLDCEDSVEYPSGAMGPCSVWRLQDFPYSSNMSWKDFLKMIGRTFAENEWVTNSLPNGNIEDYETSGRYDLLLQDAIPHNNMMTVVLNSHQVDAVRHMSKLVSNFGWGSFRIKRATGDLILYAGTLGSLADAMVDIIPPAPKLKAKVPGKATTLGMKRKG